MAKRVTRIAINGFGRIGRLSYRAAQHHPGLEIVAINDLADTATLAHLLQYDTSYGIYEKPVEHDETHLVVDGDRIPVSALTEPEKLPWGDLEIDVVLECTGRFTDREGASRHLEAGARRVIISAPPKESTTPTYMIGVNEKDYDGAPVISNASCTTNCIATVTHALHQEVGIVKSMMSTVHSYTASQNLQDGPSGDLREARAAAENIVPAHTGAAISVTEIIPDLRDRFNGNSYRVPTPVGSICEIVALMKRSVTVEEVNQMFRKRSASPAYRHVLEVTDAPLVSSDIVGNPHSAIVDLALTQVVDGDLLKVVAWYDNEWGYANRLVEMARVVGGTL
jgi:glyceraldehyde 3-phosphate dehydrogenase